MPNTGVPVPQAVATGKALDDHNAHVHPYDAPGRFVVRDAVTFDWGSENFVQDEAWHNNGLDLTGIVPAGAIAVLFKIVVQAVGVGKSFQLRRSAGYPLNACDARTQVSGLQIDSPGVCIAIDSDRKVDYWVSGPPWIGIWVTVIGWFI